MQTETIFPWLKTIWQSLLLRKSQNRLPHALLFSGADGVGKKELAQSFANYLLCDSPKEDGACGNCKACRLQHAASHPDFIRVTPEEGAQLIKIDQIREIVSFVNSTSMLNGYRVILINPATAMNIYAANALLKTLEEPTANTLLILICNQSLRLPATVSSRCQKISFLKPDRGTALEWLHAKINDRDIKELSFALDLADGAPLQAHNFLINDTITLRRDLYDGLVQLSLQQADPLQFAAKWEDQDIKMTLSLLLVWVQDILRYKLTGSQSQLINADYDSAIAKLTNKITQLSLLQYTDSIQKIYAQLLNSLNMNRQLLLKEVFIKWVKLC